MLQVLQPGGDITTLNGADPLLDPRRLTALKELDLLQAPPQDSLSVISRLASRLLGVPISALSLISWDRQVTAGQHGLMADPPGYAAVETPLTHSFCQHVVRADAAFTVADARNHELVRENGAIVDSNIIAYAGVPIRVDGQCIGAFCACDVAPRDWSDDDVVVLRELAAVAVDALELKRTRQDGGLRDALTGLPRRALFEEFVGRQLAAGTPTTVVAIDLMAFRLFNEAWGHDAGDQILTAVAQRLRRAAGSDDAVCRVAGDEFLVAVCGAEPETVVVQRLTTAVSTPPICVEGLDQPVSAQCVAIASGTVVDASELVDDALASLSAFKASSDTRRSERAPGPARVRLQIRNGIAGAELRDELQVHYQPLIDLATNEVVSFEALLRWQHPELGLVSPIDFIPVAERTGAIVPIGEWVLHQACRDLAAWRKITGDQSLTVAVNVAPEQVRLATFDEAVARALIAAELPPSALALEITERTILEDRSVERRTIEALRARGIDLHLDDFGTGYSSLGYLTRFPLTVLKIDQMFVRRLGIDAKATALVEGILAIAKALGLETIAEGVETQAQHDLLADMGCRQGQGFLFARPCPADDVPRLLGVSES